MANTPKYLLQCLDLVTTAPAVAEAAMGAGSPETLHVNRMRRVFADPNIIGVGVSEKETLGKKTGELSLCFYVEKKVAKSRVKPDKLVPPVMRSPDGRAVFTDVKAIGRIVPQMNKKAKPIQSGFSVGHVDITAGTVGAIVAKDKKLFILSNSHVLADSGNGKIGDKVVYPGPADGGKLPANLAGTLSKFIKFKVGGQFVNHVDAALCAIDLPRLNDLNKSIRGVTGLPQTIQAARGMKVMMRGRTSGDSEGEVEDVNFRVAIDYEGVGSVGFTEQVLCTRYSKPGDSGSIIVDKASRKVVGLHFAGANGGSVFNPIANVIKALGFKFVEA